MDIIPERESVSIPPYKNFFNLPLKKQRLTLVLFLCVLILLYIFTSPPSEFPSGKTVRITKGATAETASLLLESERVIRSSLTLKTILFLAGTETKVAAGDYIFSSPENVFTVAYRLSAGGFGLTSVRVTIPEGTASFDIPRLFGKEFYDFDGEKFIALAAGKEGYLFPDTYLLYPDITAEGVVKILEDTFERKIKEHDKEITISGKNLRDIIIMASIIEKEAKKPEDRLLVSGILWKRLSINMPLQVDAPFAYVSDKSTYELTTDDLKQDSPYNTYKNTGLPPGPIGSPGIEAILAAVRPKSSPYLYYLSDKKGNIHYAVTFEEHKQNKLKYL